MGTAGTTIELRSGEALRPFVRALAKLRTTVFREYPYLYDGSEAYEAEYLASYAASEESLVVLARDGKTIVGASTALPLTAHGESLTPCFEAQGIDPANVYYFGESLLDARYRGRGIGHAFFDARENNARVLGRFTHTAFCAVDRPENHPSRPSGYLPHDAFWTKRGYTKRSDMKATMKWKEVGSEGEREQTLTFWIRPL